MRSESTIGEALSRIAETFSRLLVQHLQLLRSELETEGRQIAARGRSVGIVAARALPFVIGGVVVASFGLAQLLGLALEPWLGRSAVPLCMLACGLFEAVVAGEWLRRAWVRSARPRTETAAASDPPVMPPAPRQPATLQRSELPQGRTRQTTGPACVPVAFEEKPYGSMG